VVLCGDGCYGVSVLAVVGAGCAAGVWGGVQYELERRAPHVGSVPLCDGG
jgi:hypothetical protein